MAAFLANVGVNAAHRIHSPLHPDGTFELLPIPEKEPWAPPMLRLPSIWAGRAVHLDVRPIKQSYARIGPQGRQ